jgi:hypothetical protein
MDNGPVKINHVDILKHISTGHYFMLYTLLSAFYVYMHILCADEFDFNQIMLLFSIFFEPEHDESELSINLTNSNVKITSSTALS